MNHKIKFFLFLSIFNLLFFFNPVIAHAGEGSPFNRIVIFGDSLSDDGNLFWYVFGFMPKSPPYFSGRFTNGSVWSEHLSKHFYENKYISTQNYAVGGETAVFHNPLNGYLPCSLTMSVDKYLLHTLLRNRSRHLFIIWIGSNDYLPGADNVDEATTKVVNTIKANIETLIYYGGKNFLIFNIPDIGKSPFGRGSAKKDNFRDLTVAHNAKLAKAIAQIQDDYKGINIHLFDIYSLFENFIKNNKDENEKNHANIINIATACWPGGYRFKNEDINEEYILQRLQEHMRKTKSFKSDDDHNLKNIDFKTLSHLIKISPALREAFLVADNAEKGVKPCEKPDEYLFWDKVHPTAIIHRLLSYRIVEFINKNYQKE